MTPSLAVAAALLAAGAPDTARLEDFPAAAADATPTHCTADKAWCVRVVQEAGGGRWTLTVFDGPPGANRQPLLSEPLPEAGQATYGLWPRIVRLGRPEGGVLIGVVSRLSQGFSGGGATFEDLNLVRVRPASGAYAAKTVLTAPLRASVMVRACFGERDERNRLGACHDEYELDARLALAPGATAGMPDLVYETEATTFPGEVSRDADSTQRRPLKKSDLVKVRDGACSYRVTMTFDAAAGEYSPDRALPECGNYVAQ